jgi:hypothetical protein
VDNAGSQALDASDYLGSPGTLYPAPLLLGRACELNTNQQDKIVLHDDRRTVDITSDIRARDRRALGAARGRPASTTGGCAPSVMMRIWSTSWRRAVAFGVSDSPPGALAFHRLPPLVCGGDWMCARRPVRRN